MIGFLTLTQQKANGFPGEQISINAERINVVRPEADGAIVTLADGSEIYVTESHNSVMLLMTKLTDIFNR